MHLQYIISIRNMVSILCVPVVFTAKFPSLIQTLGAPPNISTAVPAHTKAACSLLLGKAGNTS